MEFKHQTVRDLAWAISSPPLMAQPDDQCLWPDSAWYQDAVEENLSILIETDRNPAQLEQLLAEQKDRRLGKYFETMWAYWFARHPRYQVIAHNLQIIIDGETLGEMDFIILDKKTGMTVHWEVAVKFYLGIADTRQQCGWYGPNLRDRLDIKVAHLQNRQSALSNGDRVRQWLKAQSITIDSSAVILKGRLYYPWSLHGEISSDANTVTDVSPQGCSPEHEYSWWLSKPQFATEIDDDELIIPLINRGYMEKISTETVKEFESKKTIFENESNKKIRFPLHVQLCNRRHSWDRVFLTGTNWPSEKA